MNLDDLLIKTVEENASDLHITVGSPPRIRKGGTLIPLNQEVLNPEIVKSILESKMNNLVIPADMLY